jgi:hypothetical protein
MGLDTSHNCWHGSYSAFSRWRDKLAEAAGYAFTVEGRDTIMLDWGHIEEKNYFGEWDKDPSDPLILLIAHSDCEGVIKAKHTAILADRLAELLPLLEGDGGGHIGLYRDKTKQFIDGLRAAHAANEDVDFH